MSRTIHTAAALALAWAAYAGVLQSGAISGRMLASVAGLTMGGPDNG